MRDSSPGVSTSRMTRLPIKSYKNAFLRMLFENDAILIVGETGSGKTTQVPQWCLDYCVRKTKQCSVACTQPRRIAAMSIAERVAKENGSKLGDVVGYSVRFESCVSNKTRLKYLTDGMLLREAMLDELLSSYAIIILDEAHERTLQTEILCGVVKRALNARNSTNNPDKDLPKLKVIIMSATINVKLFKKYFNTPILNIEGRQHSVQDMFAETPQPDLETATLISVFQIHRTCDEGDILVFCSGQDEIQSLVISTHRALKQAPEAMKNLKPLPLYASLPAAQQMKIFDRTKSNSQTNGFTTNGYDHKTSPPGTNQKAPAFMRRVIYATNVAETSITIPNIKFVIDTGKVKCRTFCPKTGLDTFKVTTISKAQAKQRSGRAGRIAPGTCYRLYTNEEHAKMHDHLPPEIRRSNLDSVVLQLISIGINNVSSFEFLERPDDARIKAALENLLTLQAIKPKPIRTPTTNGSGNKMNGSTNSSTSEHSDRRESPQPKKFASLSHDGDDMLNLSYDLTALGKKLCIFPLGPSMSRIIMAANELGCLDEALIVVSLLSIDNLFHIPTFKQSQAESALQKFHSSEGDTVMLLKVYKAFKRTNLLNKIGLKNWCTGHFIHMKNLKTACMIRKQLTLLCRDHGMDSSTCGQDTTKLRRALTYGLFNNVATMWDGKYRNKSINDIHIHPSSCLFKMKPDCILYAEIVETNKCYMRNCTLVDQNWVREVSSHNLKLATSSSETPLSLQET